MDAVTGGDGFVVKVKTLQGIEQDVVFKTEKMPILTPDTDPLAQLGMKPDVSEPIGIFELKLGIFQAISVATERVWDISVISVRMLVGIFTGESSIKQIGGPLSIADMAGKTAQVGWHCLL